MYMMGYGTEADEYILGLYHPWSSLTDGGLYVHDGLWN